MAVLDQVTASGLEGSQELLNIMKRRVAATLWRWIHDNEDLILVQKKFWFISVTLHVRDVHSVFVALLGPDPLA